MIKQCKPIIKVVVSLMVACTLLYGGTPYMLNPSTVEAGTAPMYGEFLGDDIVYSASTNRLYKFSRAKENIYNHPTGQEDAVALYAMRFDGTGRKLLVDTKGQGNYLSLVGSRLYFLLDGNLMSVKTDGTGYKKLMSGPIDKYVTDGQYIFYIVGGSQPNTDKLYRLNMDGTGLKKLGSGKIYDSIFIAGNWLWVNKLGPTERMAKDGSKLTIYDEHKIMHVVNTDKGLVYAESGGAIVQANSDGSGMRKIFDDKDSYDKKTDTTLHRGIIQVKDGWVYYRVVDSTFVKNTYTFVSESIYRVRIDGTDKKLLYKTTTNSAGLIIDGIVNGRIFYHIQRPVRQEATLDELQQWSMKLDGTDKKKFIEISDQDAKELQALQVLQKRYAPYQVVPGNLSDRGQGYEFKDGNSVVLVYNVHGSDVPVGWTVNLIHADKEDNLKLFQKVIGEFQDTQFTKEQMQQVLDLVKSGKQDFIEMQVGNYKITFQHRFAGEPQGFLLINANLSK